MKANNTLLTQLLSIPDHLPISVAWIGNFQAQMQVTISAVDFKTQVRSLCDNVQRLVRPKRKILHIPSRRTTLASDPQDINGNGIPDCRDWML